MRFKTKPRSMRDSRSFRKKARLLFNLSTSSTSCRKRGEVDVHKKREGEKRKDMIKKKTHILTFWSLSIGLF